MNKLKLMRNYSEASIECPVSTPKEMILLELPCLPNRFIIIGRNRAERRLEFKGPSPLQCSKESSMTVRCTVMLNTNIRTYAIGSDMLKIWGKCARLARIELEYMECGSIRRFTQMKDLSVN
jgi:hypothetical protein